MPKNANKNEKNMFLYTLSFCHFTSRIFVLTFIDQHIVSSHAHQLHRTKDSDLSNAVDKGLICQKKIMSD